MTAPEDETGRYRQRRRTRAAIVEAAARLLAAGGEPSVAEIAEEADISRRTVYLHFPTLDQLLLDATLGVLSQDTTDAAIAAAGTRGSAEARAAAKLDVVVAESLRTLSLGRSLVRLTVETPAGTADVPRRGYRRTRWVEAALLPVRDQLDDAGHERLVSALTAVVGWEALVVLQDVRALSPDAQRETVAWMVRALLAAALATPRRGRAAGDGRRPAEG